ncbi:hypothetical protein RF11_04960 [Thelohanellus kitauei]|uniref:Uncharacterized protein n=1 Tax=Thelohanellus kitauei TaxID=669202 RepID=A0A0C2MFD2_THEKT|nr:hypothetical protein RF11_04960 [Thelohanellus kitauei]
MAADRSDVVDVPPPPPFDTPTSNFPLDIFPCFDISAVGLSKRTTPLMLPPAGTDPEADRVFDAPNSRVLSCPPHPHRRRLQCATLLINHGRTRLLCAIDALGNGQREGGEARVTSRLHHFEVACYVSTGA